MGKESTLQPVYLIVGDDELKREAVIDRLKKRLETYGDLSFNSDTFDAATVEPGTLTSACNTVPFASDYRLVLLQNIEDAPKAILDEATNYLGSPSPCTILAINGAKLAKNTRLYKAVSSFPQAVIACDLPKDAELPQMVRSMAIGHGVVFSDQAARRLAEFIGSNTVALNKEIAKIALSHRSSDPVSAAEIEQLVADTSQVKPWLFADAFAKRDVATCINLLDRLENDSPYYLISLLQGRIRDLIAAREVGSSAKDLAAVLGRQEWQVRQYPRWASTFPAGKLEAILISSVDAERAMKTGADPRDVLVEFLLQSLS